MKASPRMSVGARDRRVLLQLSVAAGCLFASLAGVESAAAQSAWGWTGSFGDDAVEVLFLGDVQVFRPDPTTAFRNVRETLKKADLVYANYEGMLVRSNCAGCAREIRRRNPGEVEGTFDVPGFRSWVHPGPEGVLGLKAGNVTVVGIANNMAYGTENIVNTMRILDANGIAYAGGGRNVDEAHAPTIVERKGVRFAFLQYTARYYGSSETFATANKPGVARIQSIDGRTIDPFDLDRLRADVRDARARANIVIVSQHNRRGGVPTQFGAVAMTPQAPNEHPADREEYQELFAREALDAGADIVLGHGNHGVDGVGIYSGKPIVYNTAQSNFDQPGYENDKEGMVVRIVVQGASGVKAIQRVSFVPVWRDDNNDMLMIDPSTGQGAELVDFIKGLSPGVPLRIDGQEVVLIDKSTEASAQR